MYNKSKSLFSAIILLILLVSLIPVNSVDALVSSAPPVDMFQLPWDQGIAWYAIDGIDNGNKRPLSSSHNYALGGAVDFAPHPNMVTGEDTSKFWVTAAASGTVVATATCYVTLSHDNGWLTQYQFLGNIQVKLGDVVARNQRIGIIADGVRIKYCPGYQEPNVPHVHFVMRPSIIDASLAGWQVKYSRYFNSTTFTKNGITVGLNKPLLNVMDAFVTPTTVPTQPVTATPTMYMSPTPTIAGPYVSTTLTQQTIDVGGSTLVTVRLNNVPPEGYNSTEFTCSYNANLFEVSIINPAGLFGADPVVAISGPGSQSFVVAIAGSKGNKATTSGTAFTFNVKATNPGWTVIECRARVSQGTNALTEIPFAVDYLTIQGGTSTPSPLPSPTGQSSPSSTPGPVYPTITPFPTNTPGGDWLTFINATYRFMFGYPANSQVVTGGTDTYTRINLPFVAGTNLVEKYLEVHVAENTSVCQSPLATSSMLNTSESVIISGLTFLKQTGGDGAVGSLYEWIAYSTVRDNVCVSLDFVLHSLNPGALPTATPVFDYAAESAVFGQIASTFSWLAVSPTVTSTPTASTLPSVTATASPAPLFTFTPTMSPTPSGGNSVVAGEVLAGKPVVVNVYDANTILVATMETTADHRFRLEVPPGTYTVVAISHGFLRASATVTLTADNTRILPTVILLAGDIDGNNVVDQFDALTIGMSYNSSIPEVADLNSDGIINVLDLEQLAKNYRKTGPVPWQ